MNLARPKPFTIPAAQVPASDELCQAGLWLLPSRNREDRARDCIRACTAAGQSTPGLLIEDGCHYRMNFTITDRQWTKLHLDGHQELAGALNAAYVANPNLAWYGVISDGIRPVTDGWDRKLLAAMDGRLMVSSSDNGWRENDRLAGVHVIPGWIVRAVGYLYPPGLVHLFIDDVWEHLGGAMNNWAYLPSVTVNDHHFANSRFHAAADGNNRREFRGQPYAGSDETRFWAWRTNGEFDAAVDRIKTAWREMTGDDWRAAA